MVKVHRLEGLGASRSKLPVLMRYWDSAARRAARRERALQREYRSLDRLLSNRRWWPGLLLVLLLSSLLWLLALHLYTHIRVQALKFQLFRVVDHLYQSHPSCNGVSALPNQSFQARSPGNQLLIDQSISRVVSPSRYLSGRNSLSANARLLRLKKACRPEGWWRDFSSEDSADNSPFKERATSYASSSPNLVNQNMASSGDPYMFNLLAKDLEDRECPHP